jgi:hypothetical protein
MFLKMERRKKIQSFRKDLHFDQYCEIILQNLMVDYVHGEMIKSAVLVLNVSKLTLREQTPRYRV